MPQTMCLFVLFLLVAYATFAQKPEYLQISDNYIDNQEKPKNDIGDYLNNLEEVNISCEESKCDGNGNNDVNSSTTKKPHSFQLYNKSCPSFRLPPFFPRQNCNIDRECWPRICCGNDGTNGKKYCRIPVPKWKNKLMKTITKSLRSSQSFLQCSQPPPKRYDLFPRKCRTIMDCFPDLCCPENGNNICRPPKQSLMSLMSRMSAYRTQNY
ncbi:uncharacterized protein LOC126899167 isoform X2 [Daktulosphaira vitifoliae]|uniref:uncharacterized protein LOC126899167 isoform X2 n=1 Tax=Daktulosphaira vitifoliae TaxID=58002 RepID=UPI0021AA746C|nr:uncharacterized protein LOC126899167 isoform X2 [Daktulosphaira vitifoliae]